MKINLILPFTNLTGGTKVAFEYANRLKENGHDVLCYVPVISYKFNETGLKGEIIRIKATLGNVVKGRSKVKWFPLKAKVESVPFVSNLFIRDADATIATAWPTAYSVNSLNPSKGEKYYFVQHYERWSGPEKAVDGSYKLPLKKIVIVRWLEDLMRDKFHEDICALIPNGLDFEKFYNQDKKFNKEKVVLMLYHDLEWKGFKDGVKAFEMAKVKCPELKLRLFGMVRGNDIPEYAEFYQNPHPEKLRDLYATSDIFVAPSWSEGWNLPPMEAMACKCAVVATNVGCIMDIGIHKKTAMVCEPHDTQLMAHSIEELVRNQELLEEISYGGYDKIKGYTWEKSTAMLEAVLKGKTFCDRG